MGILTTNACQVIGHVDSHGHGVGGGVVLGSGEQRLPDDELPVAALVVLAVLAGRGVGGLLGEGGLARGTGDVALGVQVAREVGVGRAVDAHGDLDAAALGDRGDGAVGEGILGLGTDVNVTSGDGPAALVHNVGRNL